MEHSYSSLTKKYFENSVHIFAVGCALGIISLLSLLIGTFTGAFLLVRDGLTSFAFTCVVLFCYYSINYSKDFRRDKEFTYGYTRFTIIATFVNTVYILFEFLELIHELTEGISEHEEEINPHDFDENYIYFGIRIFSIRIALLLLLIFWTLNDVSLIRKIEDILERNFPNYERKFTEDIDVTHDSYKTDRTLRNCSLLYFSLKILIIYELLGNMSGIWGMLVSYHLGLVQHLAIVLRTVVCLSLSIGPFMQSSYILLQKNSPRDHLLEAKIKNDLTFVEGVAAVSKLHIWTIEGLQRVCN